MKNKIYNKLIPILILIQPLFDVLTSFMTRANISITIGVIIKVILIGLCSIYLVFIDKKNRKSNIFILGLLAILLIFNIYLNIDIVSKKLVPYFNYTVKYAYLIIMLLYFMRWFKSGGRIKISSLRIPLIIISIVFFLALITNTAFLSYDAIRRGVSGWFNSANELGALLCLLFPISIYNAFHNKDGNKIDLILFFSCAAMLILVGTKTGLFGFVIILVSYILYRLITIKKNKLDYKILIAIMVLIVPFLFFKEVPAIYNTRLKISDKNITSINKTNVNKVLLSGRDKFKSTMQKNRENIGFGQVMFGKIVLKKNNLILIVEQDILDIYYMYGLLGIGILVAFYLYIFIKIISYFFKDFKNNIYDAGIVMCTLSIVLTFAISYISGHVLLSPSVSTYLILVTVILLYRCEKNDKRKRVMFISSVGGHLTQLLEFKKIFDKYDYVLITEKNDVTKDMSNKYNMAYLPYGSRNQKFIYPFILFYNCLKSLFYLLKYRPDVIVTTGANTAAATCCLGKIFGKKVIYIESFAKRTSPTITGKYIYKLHAYTTFVVQWESMLKFYPNASYWGGIY